jgi:CheY-like chemotaxis protein
VGVVRLLLKDMKSAIFTVADELSLTEAIAGAQFDLVIADLSFPVSAGANVERLLQRLIQIDDEGLIVGISLTAAKYYKDKELNREESSPALALPRRSHCVAAELHVHCGRS